MSNRHLCFFYGTLKAGFGNNRLIKAGRLVGPATTVEKFLLMDFGGYPGMYAAPFAPNVSAIAEEHVQPIKGELWEIDDDMLQRCDWLEGHPTHYKRTPIEVIVKIGDVHEACTEKRDCETYLYQGSVHGRPCEEGIWPRPMRVAIP